MKNTHNDSQTKSLCKTDFYKEEREKALSYKEQLDMKRHQEQAQKRAKENNFLLTNNVAYQKALKVSIEFIHISRKLMEKHDYTVLAPILNQCIRSTSSVAANLSESSTPFISRRDRIFKMKIAFKECVESIHWLDTLFTIGELTLEEYCSLKDECNQISKILFKTISTLRVNMEEPKST